MKTKKPSDMAEGTENELSGSDLDKGYKRMKCDKPKDHPGFSNGRCPVDIEGTEYLDGAWK